MGKSEVGLFQVGKPEVSFFQVGELKVGMFQTSGSVLSLFLCNRRPFGTAHSEAGKSKRQVPQVSTLQVYTTQFQSISVSLAMVSPIHRPAHSATFMSCQQPLHVSAV
jgi:hypothetical protein